MGNTIESIQRGKDPAIQVQSEVGSNVDEVQSSTVLDDGGNEENSGLIPPTDTEIPQGSSRDGMIHELDDEVHLSGSSDVLRGGVNSHPKMDDAASRHDDRTDTGIQVLSSVDPKATTLHRGSELSEKTDIAASAKEQIISRSEEARKDSGILIDDMAELGNISEDLKEEEEEGKDFSSEITDVCQSSLNWRSSIASTVTDSSECYQTAHEEDSEKDDTCETHDNFCDNDDSNIDDSTGNIDDTEDILVTTLCASDIRNEFAKETLESDMHLTQEKSPNGENVIDAVDLEISMINTETEMAYKESSKSKIPIEGTAVYLRARNQSLKHELVAHNVVNTTQIEHEVDSQSHLSELEGFEVANDHFKLDNISGYSVMQVKEYHNEKILSSMCPAVTEAFDVPVNNLHHSDSVSQRPEEDGSSELGYVAEKHCGDDASPIEKSICPKIIDSSNEDDYDDDISSDVSRVDINNVDSDHNPRFEENIRVSSAVSDMNMSSVKVSDCNVKEDEISSEDLENNETCCGGDSPIRDTLDRKPYSSIQFSGNNLDAMHDTDEVDFYSRDVKCLEDGLPRTSRSSNAVEVVEKSSSCEEIGFEHVVESAVEANFELDEKLANKDDEDDVDSSAADFMWHILKNLQVESHKKGQCSETLQVDSREFEGYVELGSDAAYNFESMSKNIIRDQSKLKDPDDLMESDVASFTAVEKQPWDRREEEEEEEEPAPDYSLSSDDDDGKIDDAEIEYRELSGDEAIPTPPIDYDSPPISASAPVTAGEIGFFNASFQALVEPALFESRFDKKRLAQASADSSGNIGRTLQFVQGHALSGADVVVADEEDDDNHPIGRFQRRTSLRPSKRGRSMNWPRKSLPSISLSYPELPEEESGAADDSVIGSETVFHEAPRTPYTASQNRWLASRPVLADVNSRDSGHVPARELPTQNDGSRLMKSRNEDTLEKRGLSKFRRPEESADDTEWTPYMVVLRKDPSGFGFVLSHHGSPVTILRVQENGVAAKNGVKVGDRINKVNGSLVSRNVCSEISEMIRSSGDLVRLELLRNSSEVGAVPMTPILYESMTLKHLKSTAPLPARSISEMPLTKNGRSSTRSLFTAPSETLMDKPFTDPNLLKQNPAHLAIFLHYLFNEDNPCPMLFSMLSDYYQNCLKESSLNSARRWAYEIYSTFLAADAPLKLNVESAKVAQVDRLMKELTKAKEPELRSLFQQIHNIIKKDIIQQLNSLIEKKSWSNSTEYQYQLLKMNLDRGVEFQIIDDVLWKTFEHCLAQDYDDTKRAIAYAVATFFRQVGFSGARNSNILENCPMFMSNDKKPLKNKMKKHFANKGHQFSPHQFTAVTHCHACQKVIWGLGHQAYKCNNCDLNLHRCCAEKTTEACIGFRAKDSKRSVRDIIPGRKYLTTSGKEEHRSFMFPAIFDQDASKSQPTGEQSDRRINRLGVPEVGFEHQGHSPQSFSASDDSDLEVGSELPDLSEFISREDLRQMKDKERKRQQIINELFHTERLHVRTLKVMDRVFLRPMRDDPAFYQDFIRLLFPNLQDLIQIHGDLNKEFIAKRKQKKPVCDIGQLLFNKFSGSQGEMFKSACASFCADQAFALEVLKAKQKREPKISAFLQEAATNRLCRRLELKDFLPRQMHRLTKYPLLIENLRKCTPHQDIFWANAGNDLRKKCKKNKSTNEEYIYLSEALHLTKGLLEHVNQEVKVVQNRRHLRDMQQRLDHRAADSSAHPVLKEYRNFDLTKHTLVYDGEVTWRPIHARSRPIEVHMVLLEEILVVLQKQDDRLLLRCSSTTVEGFKFQCCPIMRLNKLMVKDDARDPCSFFVLDSSVKSPQVYELMARSRDEKNKWCTNIQETVKRCILRHSNQTDSTASSPVDSALKDKSSSTLITNDRPSPRLVSRDSVDLSTERASEPTSPVCNVRHGQPSDKFSDNFAIDNSSGDKTETKETKLKHFKELTAHIVQLMKEKYEIETGAQMTSDGFDDDDFLEGDAEEIMNKLLRQVDVMKNLFGDQQWQQQPDDTTNETSKTPVDTISLPAEKIVNYVAVIQRMTAYLTDQVVANAEEIEKLEREFESVLRNIKMKDVIGTSVEQDKSPSDECDESDFDRKSSKN